MVAVAVGRTLTLFRLTPRGAARSAPKCDSLPLSSSAKIRSNAASSLSRLPFLPLDDRPAQRRGGGNDEHPVLHASPGVPSPSSFQVKPRFFSSTSIDTESSSNTVQVSIEDALNVTKRALMKIGWDEEDANVQAEIMVSAELCGNNQGLVKMYQPELMQPSPHSGKPVVERDTPTSAAINAHQSPGMLAAVRAADLAVDKTKGGGGASIAIVTSHNTSTSSGQLAYYVERMVRRGNVVAVAMANSPEFVAAAPGGNRVFGTNPLAVGVPVAHSDTPFTFDMATSAIALFGVLSAKAKGEPLPAGVAYGKDGTFTTDAAEALEGGAIATFGGHKGMGLSLCVELLAGALSGAAVLGQCDSKRDAKSWGHTMIAIRPDALTDQFDVKAASILRAVKASGDNIRIPGERSAQTAAERRKAGVMPIPVRIWESICRTAEHGLPS